VYADGPIQETVDLPDGSVWRNIVTPAKSKVAETLDEFRGQYLYNMLDSNVRDFNAAVPMLAQWDDHQVTNNWCPNEFLLADDRYSVQSAALLAARGARAFHEMMPTRQSAEESHRVYRKIAYGPLLDIFFLDQRTYRGDNTPNRQEEGALFLGAAQLAWLREELAASRALWKVIRTHKASGLGPIDAVRLLDLGFDELDHLVGQVDHVVAHACLAEVGNTGGHLRMDLLAIFVDQGERTADRWHDNIVVPMGVPASLSHGREAITSDAYAVVVSLHGGFSGDVVAHLNSSVMVEDVDSAGMRFYAAPVDSVILPLRDSCPTTFYGSQS
jgi:hypothetical protein